jgi:23S rRNA (adenine2503-C2)-methyltransferase
MENTREHILGLTPSELTERLAKLGMPKFRTKQIHEWIFQRRASSFEEMTNLGKRDREILAERFEIFTSKVVRNLTSADGTQKILLEWPTAPRGAEVRSKNQEARSGGDAEREMHLPIAPVDHGEEARAEQAVATGVGDEAITPDVATSPNLTECVMIPSDDDQCDEYGNTTVAHRRTACLSTQVGCPVGCAFCASGMEGLKGNLTVGQVVEQALRLTHNLPREGGGHRLTNVVFMGMGEPLANFNATVGAVRVLMADWAFHISGRKITVSTVGLPPQMKRFADLEIPVTLAISLHAPNDALRKQIIPWAEKISIEQIVEAGRHYFEKTGREVTLEYIMLEGVNTLPEHARELTQVAKRLRANVNLIYYNEVPELAFKRPSGQVMFAFQNILRGAGVNVHVRKSRGREIAAACGQLARQDKKERAQNGGMVQVGVPRTAKSE